MSEIVTILMCESCGHPAHHCATVGQFCNVQIINVDGVTVDGINVCKCPSTTPSSSECACRGSKPWLRKHTDSSCDNDYPCHDPNVCHFVWDGLRKEETADSMGAPLWCHKRKGHGGPHSTHNDCGHMDGHWICGRKPGPDGVCEEHAKKDPP